MDDILKFNNITKYEIRNKKSNKVYFEYLNENFTYNRNTPRDAAYKINVSKIKWILYIFLSEIKLSRDSLPKNENYFW